MKVDLKIHAVHFDADKDLKTFIGDKVDKLTLFYDKIITGEVFLRLDGSDAENKVAEVKLLIPGTELFAKKQCKSFEEATDLAVEAIRRQLKKRKEKISKK